MPPPEPKETPMREREMEGGERDGVVRERWRGERELRGRDGGSVREREVDRGGGDC